MPSTIIDTQPVAGQLHQHLAAAVTGHAAIAKRAAEHVTAALARRGEGQAAAVAASGQG